MRCQPQLAGQATGADYCGFNQIDNPVFNFKKRDRHGEKNFKE
jgi:hypothetical protein